MFFYGDRPPAELRKRMEAQQALEAGKSDIGWGQQIRSYVFDQSRVKDLSTNVEVGNVKGVMDGDLDGFIAASLKQVCKHPAPKNNNAPEGALLFATRKLQVLRN
jgi:protein subunit release factor A